MSVFSKYSKWILAALLLLSMLCFALPFSSFPAEGGALTGFALLDGAENAHFYALTLLAAILGLCAALFEPDGRKKHGESMLLSLIAAALSAYLMRLEKESAAIGIGLKLTFVMLAAAFAASALGLYAHKKYAPAPAKKPVKGISYIARVAVLGAVSAVLYYFEVPVIPPIYKLDLSAVPALIAGFAMGPGASLGVMAVKDLIGLLHTSSMGVGELADFLMSGSMTVVASMIYLRRHTLKGALLGLSLGTLAMGVVGGLANYFIMIPFYVQVMNMPLEVILSLIAKTVPAVDSLWKMILLAVVPFNLLKGVVLSAVTMLLYKRIAPFLKNL
ncbi:MAG: ECF transporter S component [Clostridia bacterium]|nr:ECF transporter S component [Clostridia bacterium]